MAGEHFNKISRRSWFKTLYRLLYGLLAGVLFYLNSGFLRYIRPDRRTVEVPLGDITGDVWRHGAFYINRRSEPWIVISRRCTHLGCTVQLNDDGQTIACPCHGSRFNLRGEYLQGPAGRDLERLPYTITDNDRLKIEISS